MFFEGSFKIQTDCIVHFKGYNLFLRNLYRALDQMEIILIFEKKIFCFFFNFYFLIILILNDSIITENYSLLDNFAVLSNYFCHFTVCDTQ